MLICLGVITAILFIVLIILIAVLLRTKRKQSKEGCPSYISNPPEMDNDHNTYMIRKPNQGNCPASENQGYPRDTVALQGREAKEKEHLKIPRLSESEKTGILNHNNVGLINETEVLGLQKQRPRATLSYQCSGKVYNYPMNSDFINIGRDPEQCDMIISHDSYIGRNHAIVYNKKDNYYLVDLASINGTFINAQRITGVIGLRDGDTFKLANTEVTIQINKQ